MASGLVSLDKGLDILCVFSTEQRKLSALEISKQLHIPLSTTYKYLDLLLKKKFLEKNPHSRRFSLGLIVFKLGSIVFNNAKLIDIAISHMKSLSKFTEETVFLTTIKGWEAVCVETVETNRLIKLTMEPGATLPMHAGAPSKILLAYQDSTFVNDLIRNSGLPKLTENTITDPSQLKNELQRIRKNGFAFSDSEVDAMAIGIAGPILDHNGKLVAGITVAGPSERIRKRNLAELINSVKDSAQNISYALGFGKPLENRSDRDETP